MARQASSLDQLCITNVSQCWPAAACRGFVRDGTLLNGGAGARLRLAAQRGLQWQRVVASVFQQGSAVCAVYGK